MDFYRRYSVYSVLHSGSHGPIIEEKRKDPLRQPKNHFYQTATLRKNFLDEGKDKIPETD